MADPRAAFPSPGVSNRCPADIAVHGPPPPPAGSGIAVRWTLPRFGGAVKVGGDELDIIPRGQGHGHEEGPALVDVRKDRGTRQPRIASTSITQSMKRRQPGPAGKHALAWKHSWRDRPSMTIRSARPHRKRTAGLGGGEVDMIGDAILAGDADRERPAPALNIGWSSPSALSELDRVRPSPMPMP
jgi:hypothetical protein